jgi:hypothetical protein
MPLGELNWRKGNEAICSSTPASAPVEVCAGDAGNIRFTHLPMNSLGKLVPSTEEMELRCRTRWGMCCPLVCSRLLLWVAFASRGIKCGLVGD